MNTPLHPTYLFVGPQQQLEEHALQFLRQHLCPTPDMQHKQSLLAQQNCITCTQLYKRQHHSIVWIEPEKDYTVNDIEIIFEKTTFALDPGQRLFFILNNTHTFNQATANRLLKVLEEPPTGYHFLLLTHNENAMLPTIVSRSLVQHLHVQHTQHTHPLIDFFIHEKKLTDPFGFEATLRKEKPTDSESISLAETIFHHYTSRIHQHYQGAASSASHANELRLHQQRAAFLEECMKKPPQSGSSGLFWKNTYLLFPR